ncbi:hypothetical protein AVEN_110049-1 [Araneus ventricosus]|uniref:Uncharacterized protein n=1 Tax=Araneus ventricosus TaxID=182803 RepID=A0A4Y2NM61_ARAVE|nr:hypothetical protein AVEN_110049-1 [Araneus ventricosus]
MIAAELSCTLKQKEHVVTQVPKQPKNPSMRNPILVADSLSDEETLPASKVSLSKISTQTELEQYQTEASFTKDSEEWRGTRSSTNPRLDNETKITRFFQEAIGLKYAEQRKAAMDAQMQNMKTRIWSLVPAPPKEVKIAGCCWEWSIGVVNETTVISTSDYKLDIGNIAEISLTAYSDADFASCRYDRISLGDHIVFCGNVPVSWQTAKQRSVTLSSMEAEFPSICETETELMWLKNVLEECRSTNMLLGDIP